MFFFISIYIYIYLHFIYIIYIYVYTHHIYTYICLSHIYFYMHSTYVWRTPKRCKRSYHFGVSHLTASQANTKLSISPPTEKRLPAADRFSPGFHAALGGCSWCKLIISASPKKGVGLDNLQALDLRPSQALAFCVPKLDGMMSSKIWSLPLPYITWGSWGVSIGVTGWLLVQFREL